MGVSATVNVSFKDPISDTDLARIIKSGAVTGSVRPYIDVLFTEVSVSRLLVFAKAHDITLEELRHVYDSYVKPRYRNSDFERLF